MVGKRDGIWGKLHSLALYWKGWRYIYRATDMHTHVQLVYYVMLNIILIFNLLWMPSSIHTKVQCCLSWIHFMTMMTMKDNLILFLLISHYTLGKKCGSFVKISGDIRRGWSTQSPNKIRWKLTILYYLSQMKLYLYLSFLRKPLDTCHYKPLQLGKWRIYLDLIKHLLMKYGIQVLGS